MAYPTEIKIIENDYSVPMPVIEYIRHENPQVVNMLEHNATYGRHYIDEIKALDSNIKEIRLLIHNPLEHLLSDLQKERICTQIRTLKIVDFRNDVLKIGFTIARLRCVEGNPVKIAIINKIST